MRPDLVVGGKFPDIALPDTTGAIVKLSDLTRGADPIAMSRQAGTNTFIAQHVGAQNTQ